jgi:hypothetical protein
LMPRSVRTSCDGPVKVSKQLRQDRFFSCECLQAIALLGKGKQFIGRTDTQ